MQFLFKKKKQNSALKSSKSASGHRAVLGFFVLKSLDKLAFFFLDLSSKGAE